MSSDPLGLIWREEWCSNCLIRSSKFLILKGPTSSSGLICCWEDWRRDCVCEKEKIQFWNFQWTCQFLPVAAVEHWVDVIAAVNDGDEAMFQFPKHRPTLRSSEDCCHKCSLENYFLSYFVYIHNLCFQQHIPARFS